MAMEELPREYRHEPRWRLPAATTGSTRCADPAQGAAVHASRRTLVVEIGHNRAGAEAAFPRMPFMWLSTPSSEASVFLLEAGRDLAGR